MEKVVYLILLLLGLYWAHLWGQSGYEKDAFVGLFGLIGAGVGIFLFFGCLKEEIITAVRKQNRHLPRQTDDASKE